MITYLYKNLEVIMASLNEQEKLMLKECVANSPDDINKIIPIGKQIFDNHKEIYTDKMTSTIMDCINDYASNLLEEEKTNILYKSIYDYWVYGNIIDEEFYYDFINKTHLEKMEYMTFRLREKYCAHLNSKEEQDIFVDKYKTYQRFTKYYKRDVMQITSENDFSIFEKFVQKHPSFVVKPKDMAFGLGVYLVKESDYTDYKSLFESIRLNGRKNKEDIVWAKNDHIVLEELIEQDESTASVHPYSVNGIRATTVKVNGKVTVYHPWFKVGAGHQFVTSAVVGTMDAGIDEKTGIVITNGFKENGENFDIHPDTGIKINGFVIPRWNELLEMAEEVASSLDNVNYVGWDFVLTPNGWCIMEANYDGDFMWQMFFKKGMKTEFEELIQWKPESMFWWE